MHLKHANGPQTGNDLHFTSISMTVIILSFDGKFQEVRTHIPQGFYFTYAEKKLASTGQLWYFFFVFTFLPFDTELTRLALFQLNKAWPTSFLVNLISFD